MSESFADKLAKQANQHAAKAKDEADEREKEQKKLDDADSVKLRTAITELISDYPKILEEALANYWQDPTTKQRTSFGIFAQFIGKPEVLKTELEPLLNDLVKNGLKPVLLRNSSSKVFDNTWSPIGDQPNRLPGRTDLRVNNTEKFLTIKLSTSQQNIRGWQDPKIYRCQFGTEMVSVGAQFVNET